MKVYGKIGIIGLGLIGGSIAIALKDKYEIVGMSRNPDTLSYALENGIINETAQSYSDFSQCEAVIVCTPLAIVRKTVEDLYSTLGDGVIITDVGSVKGMLSGINGRIIGGHPMAGTEQSGIRSAKERLLENAYYILVDYNGNREDLEFMRNLVLDMRATPVIMTASEHDRLVAKISHLEHMAAYSIVNSAMTGNEEIVGSGFMDTTRIASSSPEFWNTVAQLNRENLTNEMTAYINTLTDLRDKISAGEDVTEILRSAKIKRDALSYKRRYMTEYVLYVDVPDTVGSIVSVLDKLSQSGVSINNLTVMNSREGVGGALRLEFKDERGYKKAKEILS
ncbi:MAG: prephenate dehydrogenase/arogenate dehydrogenase family protein [Clostridia bacterium]|nr:prephenate dehydrogenase/arogenate dehydrogenase family protein [Clostridia bacterium]